jgi:hypothetical protein
MNENIQSLPDEGTTNRIQQVDTFAAGESVLARAKSVAQQIAERVRRLTEGQRETSGEAPDSVPNAG